MVFRALVVFLELHMLHNWRCFFKSQSPNFHVPEARRFMSSIDSPCIQNVFHVFWQKWKTHIVFWILNILHERTYPTFEHLPHETLFFVAGWVRKGCNGHVWLEFRRVVQKKLLAATYLKMSTKTWSWEYCFILFSKNMLIISLPDF